MFVSKSDFVVDSEKSFLGGRDQSILKVLTLEQRNQCDQMAKLFFYILPF